MILKTKLEMPRDTYESNDPENIDILGGSIQSGGSLKIIQNTRLVVKISEYQLFSAGNSLEINKIPELFFQKEKFGNHEKFK